MMNRSARNGRSATEPTGLRRIRAPFARETDTRPARPVSRVSRPQMAQRVNDSAPTLIDMEPVPAEVGIASLPPSTTVSLVFEGAGWGVNPYDSATWPATVDGASATTLLLAKPGTSGTQNASVPPAPPTQPNAFDGARWIALDPTLWWAAKHDTRSNDEWPDVPVADVEQTREMAPIRDDRPLMELEARTRQTLGPVDAGRAAWVRHVSNPDAAGERADARTTSLHARWYNLAAVDRARVQVAADSSESGDYVAAELTKAIVGRAIALDASVEQIAEALGAAA